MANITNIVVGSRKSELALVQTRNIIHELKRQDPNLNIQIETFDALGDQVLDVTFSKIGDQSLFTKTLEVALAEKRVDCLVHSLKDLPTTMLPGMAVGAIYKRDSKFDAVIFHPKHLVSCLDDLPKGSVIGTSSLRRIALLQGMFPRLNFESVRGNLNTRLKKLDSADKYDAIVLAEAGIVRMNWQHRIGQVLDGNSLYAVGQGALGVEIRSDDKQLALLLSKLSDYTTLISCVAERAFSNDLEGGCSVPIGVSSEYKDDQLSVHGAVYSLDGTTILEDKQIATITRPEEDSEEIAITNFGVVVPKTWMEAAMAADAIGRKVAAEIKAKGADQLLTEVRATIGSS